MGMNKVWTFAIIFLVTTTHSLTVVAHEAVPGSSGFSHVIGDLGHALGFILMGMFGGIFIRLFGCRLYIFVCMAPFVALSAHSHAAISTVPGLMFFLGFCAAGAVIACCAINLGGTLLASLGVLPSRARQD